MTVGQTHLLQTGNAVAAILVNQKGHYLLQLRDERPDIWYPGRWGFFGGSVDAGDDKSQALQRELREELELEFAQPGCSRALTLICGHLVWTAISEPITRYRSLPSMKAPRCAAFPAMRR